MPNSNYRYITNASTAQRVNGHAVLHTEKASPYELRSEEVQDIMTKMPSLIIRQGTSVLFIVIFLLFTGAYFIHFPDIVTARVNIKPIYANANEYMATSTLPVEMAGKVKAGQQVLIKLPLYPFEQFGIIEGKVENIAAGTTGTTYAVRIRLVNGLVTSTNKKIDANAPLSGTAEVLTSDKTILQRLFESIRGN